MNASFPAYYTGLKPFAGLFATGLPVLMYHKLGPHPARVRLKGLYVSGRLFERQLAELRRAGFVTGAYGLPEAGGNAGKRVALTFDDGFANVLRYGTEPMARHGVRAIQFLVADLLGRSNEWEVRQGEARETLMDAAQIKEWLAAGHEIGSHTLTHPYLTRISLEQAREEISSSKKKLEDRFGLAIRHFCYPYGDWNPAVRDLVSEAEYETACTTEFGVNTSVTPAWELKRITARHQSISFKALAARLARFKCG
ncbi:MAG: Polysaccharide deacetylase [Verrucomicrobiales bacterium]|nr:Polysaccharide deacetylase [Verrucomicrobiales bacterium]